MAELSLTRARTIIRKALATGRDEGFKPLSVVVLDTGGHVKAFEREDGDRTGALRHRPWQGLWRDHAGDRRPRANGPRRTAGLFPRRREWRLRRAGRAGAGRYPVRDKRGNIVGAVGVTGDTSDNDVIAAVAGVKAVGLTPEE